MIALQRFAPLDANIARLAIQWMPAVVGKPLPGTSGRSVRPDQQIEIISPIRSKIHPEAA
jgi:hypothetical protein